MDEVVQVDKSKGIALNLNSYQGFEQVTTFFALVTPS